MTKVINSYQQNDPERSKKAEGKKRKFPCTPLREKGKGKEQSPGSLQNQSKPARARTRGNSSVYNEAGAAADEILGNCFGQPTDHALWAWYCLHHNRRLILEKAYELSSMQRQGELRDAVTAFQHWLTATFPRKGGAQ